MRKKIPSLALFLFFLQCCLYARNSFDQREFYEIRIYHFKDSLQEGMIDRYLQHAYLPALHRLGLGSIGVFKQLANDTATDKRTYVLIPFVSLEQRSSLQWQLEADAVYKSAASEYLDATYKIPAYERMESILLQAFLFAPKLQKPALNGPSRERVYELRSYESATEKILQNKIGMFNEGGEISLFKRLGFNAVFYAEVISGPKMPNLMYMTSFDNRAARDAHWQNFGADPEWKKLSSMPEYQHNVSHIDIVFLRPAAYSEM